MFNQNVIYGPGTGTFTSHTFEIIIMLLGAFVLGTWLGWALWSRYRQEAERLRLDNASLNATLAQLNADLDAARAQVAAAEGDRNSLAARMDLVTQENTDHQMRLDMLESDLRLAKERNRQLETELGLATTPAPKEEVPLEVETAPVAEVEPEPIAEPVPALVAELPQEKSSAPETQSPPAPVVIVQPMMVVAPSNEQLQSALAHSTTPEAETTHQEHIFQALVPPGQRDDLKIIEGIGPKIEEVLFKSGIDTYAELAATTVERLKDILAEAGPRFVMHDPGTWSAQALLAANGEWENLKSYQDFLNAGKRPT